MTAIPLPILAAQPVTYGLGGNHIDLLAIAGVDPDVVNKGALYRPVCDHVVFTQAICDAARPAKTVNQVPDQVRFEPFLIGDAFECGMPQSISPVSQLALNTLALSEWQQIAITVHSNPDNLNGVLNWADYANDITPATPAGLSNTIHGLIEAAACTCWSSGNLYLHVPIAYMPYFLEQSLLWWETGSNTPKIGPVSIVFDCYPNTPPTVNTGGAAAADGSEVWLYLTGPNYIGVGNVYETDTMFAQQNNHLSMAERHAIALFDTCCVTAAKAVVC